MGSKNVRKNALVCEININFKDKVWEEWGQ